MFFMMDLKEFAADDRLEGRVTIFKIWECNFAGLGREPKPQCFREHSTYHQKLIM